jgi:hypothetical protein
MIANHQDRQTFILKIPDKSNPAKMPPDHGFAVYPEKFNKEWLVP